MELQFLNWLQSIRTPFFDKFFSVYTTLGNHAEIWLLIILILFFVKKRKEAAILAVAAIIIEIFVVSLVLKPLISRPRPFMFNDTINLLIKVPGGSSFPSGHSASSLAVAMILYKENIKYKKTIMFAALLMAFSRLYVYVHYPSDVIVGILAGIVIGLFVYKNRDYFLAVYKVIFDRFDNDLFNID